MNNKKLYIFKKLNFNLMQKCLFRFLVFIPLLVYICNSIDGQKFDSSLSIVLFGDYCYFTDDNENMNAIYKMPVEEDKDVFVKINNLKNKTLIKVSDEILILFGLNNSRFSYSKYNISANNNAFINGHSFNDSILPNEGNYTIKLINENNYLLYYISSEQLILYIINLGSDDSAPSARKINKNIQTQDFQLNTIECDSFDAENIFCVYSLIEILTQN